MLRLAAPTRPDWLPAALEAIDTILLDHAHCEKKAASTAMGLIFRYQHHDALMQPLSEMVREEMRHFELMLRVLRERGIVFQRLRPSPYAARLSTEIRDDEPGRFVDTLICCALIEARSCERMKMIAEAVQDEALAALYESLLASEARHHQNYLDLAAVVTSMEQVEERLRVLAEHEARILAEPDTPIRLHS